MFKLVKYAPGRKIDGRLMLTILILKTKGRTHKEIAAITKKSTSTIINYLHRANQNFQEMPEFRAYQMFLDDLVEPAAETIEKYCKGKGEKLGGDLIASFRVLERVGLMPSSDGRANRGQQDDSLNVNNTFNMTTAVNAEININPKEDQDFADGLPEQLRRITGAIKRLPLPGMVSAPGDPQKSGN